MHPVDEAFWISHQTVCKKVNECVFKFYPLDKLKLFASVNKLFFNPANCPVSTNTPLVTIPDERCFSLGSHFFPFQIKMLQA